MNNKNLGWFVRKVFTSKFRLWIIELRKISRNRENEFGFDQRAHIKKAGMLEVVINSALGKIKRR